MTNPTPAPKDDPPFEDRTYEVFNSRRTIGVRAAHGGPFTALYLSEEVRKTASERALARDILAVAAVAAARGRLSLREQLEATVADDRHPITVYHLLPDVPTVAEYEDFKKTTLP